MSLARLIREITRTNPLPVWECKYPVEFDLREVLHIADRIEDSCQRSRCDATEDLDAALADLRAWATEQRIPTRNIRKEE